MNKTDFFKSRKLKKSNTLEEIENVQKNHFKKDS